MSSSANRLVVLAILSALGIAEDGCEGPPLCKFSNSDNCVPSAHDRLRQWQKDHEKAIELEKPPL